VLVVAEVEELEVPALLVLPRADKNPRCAELSRPPRRFAELASAFGPIREEEAAPLMDKCVSIGQLRRD